MKKACPDAGFQLASAARQSGSSDTRSCVRDHTARARHRRTPSDLRLGAPSRAKQVTLDSAARPATCASEPCRAPSKSRTKHVAIDSAPSDLHLGVPSRAKQALWLPQTICNWWTLVTPGLASATGTTTSRLRTFLHCIWVC